MPQISQFFYNQIIREALILPIFNRCCIDITKKPNHGSTFFAFLGQIVDFDATNCTISSETIRIKKVCDTPFAHNTEFFQEGKTENFRYYSPLHKLEKFVIPPIYYSNMGQFSCVLFD